MAQAQLAALFRRVQHELVMLSQFEETSAATGQKQIPVYSSTMSARN
jgi:hypothetical protein